MAGDSHLLINSMHGIVIPKCQSLKENVVSALALAASCPGIRFVHIYRRFNTLADKICNILLDGGSPEAAVSDAMILSQASVAKELSLKVCSEEWFASVAFNGVLSEAHVDSSPDWDEGVFKAHVDLSLDCDPDCDGGVSKAHVDSSPEALRSGHICWLHPESIITGCVSGRGSALCKVVVWQARASAASRNPCMDASACSVQIFCRNFFANLDRAILRLSPE